MAGQDFQLSLQQWMTEATVVVNDRYGTWNAETGSVDPPVDPNATTTTVPFLVPEDVPLEPPVDTGVPTTAAG
jgi:hypothetical protein